MGMPWKWWDLRSCTTSLLSPNVKQICCQPPTWCISKQGWDTKYCIALVHAFIISELPTFIHLALYKAEWQTFYSLAVNRWGSSCRLQNGFIQIVAIAPFMLVMHICPISQTSKSYRIAGLQCAFVSLRTRESKQDFESYIQTTSSDKRRFMNYLKEVFRKASFSGFLDSSVFVLNFSNLCEHQFFLVFPIISFAFLI